MTPAVPVPAACATCNSVLLWHDGRLVCPRPACPGHAPTPTPTSRKTR